MTKGKFFFITFFFIFCSCALQKQKNDISDQLLNKSPIHECFQMIIQNQLNEFKANIEECKTYQNQTGLTSLMMAIAKENTDIVEALLEAKADPNQTDNNGFTALIYAANKNNARAAQLLRRSGARIESVKNNLTALMMAVRNSSLDLIRALKPTPEEINIQAEDGWTALYFAVDRTDPEILEFLLNRGACTQTIDSYNQKPIDFAKEIKWSEGVKILKRKTKC